MWDISNVHPKLSASVVSFVCSFCCILLLQISSCLLILVQQISYHILTNLTREIYLFRLSTYKLNCTFIFSKVPENLLIYVRKIC
jgi:hypothetical protein